MLYKLKMKVEKKTHCLFVLNEWSYEKGEGMKKKYYRLKQRDDDRQYVSDKQIKEWKIVGILYQFLQKPIK
jgi:hypothetical protein